MAEQTAILSQEEKTSILHHLGYMSQQQAAASMSLGIPSVSQPMYLVALAIERIPESAVGRIRKYLAILEKIEGAMLDVLDQLLVDKVGNIEMRSDAGDAIEHEYKRWAQRLANDLGAPLNPYAEKFSSTGARPLSRPVIHS